MITKLNNLTNTAFKATVQLNQSKDEFETNLRKHTAYSSPIEINGFQSVITELKYVYPAEDIFQIKLDKELEIKYTPGKKSLEEGLKEKTFKIKLIPTKGIDTNIVNKLRNYFLNRVLKEDSIKKLLLTIG